MCVCCCLLASPVAVAWRDRVFLCGICALRQRPLERCCTQKAAVLHSGGTLCVGAVGWAEEHLCLAGRGGKGPCVKPWRCFQADSVSWINQRSDLL